MLRLRRKVREGFLIGDDVRVEVSGISRRYSVSLRVIAPGTVGIWRAELPAPSSVIAGTQLAKRGEVDDVVGGLGDAELATEPPRAWSRPDRPRDAQGGLVLSRRRYQSLHLEGMPLIGRATIYVDRIKVSKEDEDEVELLVGADRANRILRIELLDGGPTEKGAPLTAPRVVLALLDEPCEACPEADVRSKEKERRSVIIPCSLGEGRMCMRTPATGSEHYLVR